MIVDKQDREDLSSELIPVDRNFFARLFTYILNQNL